MSETKSYSWLAYTQLLDSALPVGGFSHSFGLETMVQAGVVQTVAHLKDFIQTMMRSWASADAMGVKAAYLYIPERKWEKLWQIDQMLHVQRAASETRDGVQKMGKRLLLLAHSMYPEMDWVPIDQAIGAGLCPGTHPVVHGLISYYFHVPLPNAAEGYLYNCMLTCVNSALRLMSIGQTQGQVLIAELLPAISAAWNEVKDQSPFDFYSTTPAADIYMMQHESLYSRLFMS